LQSNFSLFQLDITILASSKEFMINVMETEERRASVTHSMDLRGCHTIAPTTIVGSTTCGYTDCILAMLTLHNAKIGFPRRDLVRYNVDM
jgi:hypothetical protein